MNIDKASTVFVDIYVVKGNFVFDYAETKAFMRITQIYAKLVKKTSSYVFFIYICRPRNGLIAFQTLIY